MCTGTHHKAVVGPRSELHGTLLVVEREPGDVDLAGALEDTGRDVSAAAVVPDHHVGLERVVEPFMGAGGGNKRGQSINVLRKPIHAPKSIYDIVNHLMSRADGFFEQPETIFASFR